jgi:hypothetical protein
VAQVDTSILQFEQAHESRKEKEKERNNGQWTQKPYTKFKTVGRGYSVEEKNLR